jgi:hypothetical protein
MKSKPLLPLIAFILLGTHTYAHLGESLEAVKARLGSPFIPMGLADEQVFEQRQYTISQQYSFNPNGFSIDGYFINNVCVAINYLILGHKDWTNDQLQDLLLKNLEGKTWTETTPPVTEAQKEEDVIYHGYIRTWKRSDGATAIRDGYQLNFASPTYLQAVAAAKAQAKAESQKVPNL